MHQSGTLIALAWPQTVVRQVDTWYDPIMQLLGINNGKAYIAGHAALILVSHKTGELEYFDFGRYHTPYQHGRIRDRVTDHELKIPIEAVIEEDNIANLEEILIYTANNKACHGDGKLQASLYNNINFDLTYRFIKNWQSDDAIPYGPFVDPGTNCSRFVTSTGEFCVTDWLSLLMVKFPYTVSPTTTFNVKVINSFPYFYEVVGENITKVSTPLVRTLHSIKKRFL